MVSFVFLYFGVFFIARSSELFLCALLLVASIYGLCLRFRLCAFVGGFMLGFYCCGLLVPLSFGGVVIVVYVCVPLCWWLYVCTLCWWVYFCVPSVTFYFCGCFFFCLVSFYVPVFWWLYVEYYCC